MHGIFVSYSLMLSKIGGVCLIYYNEKIWKL